MTTFNATSGVIICRLRGFAVPLTPEEAIRQRVIDWLLTWGYPWHLWRAEVGHPALGRIGGRADLVFNLRPTGEASAIIEIKAHPPRPADAQQALGYARVFGATVWAVTDGTHWEVWKSGSESPTAEFPRFAAFG